ncbi:hypothetical protein Btru_035174 [Bulinus truncatus]|nr:hypothetical protein Btru_035174 [Bulinus truncatus]
MALGLGVTLSPQASLTTEVLLLNNLQKTGNESKRKKISEDNVLSKKRLKKLEEKPEVEETEEYPEVEETEEYPEVEETEEYPEAEEDVELEEDEELLEKQKYIQKSQEKLKYITKSQEKPEVCSEEPPRN